SLVIAVVGALMIIYVLVGGMKGTTWVQIVKAILLIAGAFAMTVWVLALNGFNLSSLLASAVENAADGVGEGVLNHGLQYGENPLDFISLALELVLGTAGIMSVRL